MEVIVADGMSDGRNPRARPRGGRRRDPRVTLVDNPGRIAPTGLNAALAEARGDVLVRVDGHCEIAPDYVSRCVAHLVGRRSRRGGRTARDHRRDAGGAGHRARDELRIRRRRRCVPDAKGMDGSRGHGGISGLYARAAIELAGPYDEELVRNQDDEYNYRLRSRGAPDPARRRRSRPVLQSGHGRVALPAVLSVRALEGPCPAETPTPDEVAAIRPARLRGKPCRGRARRRRLAVVPNHLPRRPRVLRPRQLRRVSGGRASGAVSPGASSSGRLRLTSRVLRPRLSGRSCPFSRSVDEDSRRAAAGSAPRGFRMRKTARSLLSTRPFRRRDRRGRRRPEVRLAHDRAARRSASRRSSRRPSGRATRSR